MSRSSCVTFRVRFFGVPDSLVLLVGCNGQRENSLSLQRLLGSERDWFVSVPLSQDPMVVEYQYVICQGSTQKEVYSTKRYVSIENENVTIHDGCLLSNGTFLKPLKDNYQLRLVLGTGTESERRNYIHWHKNEGKITSLPIRYIKMRANNAHEESTKWIDIENIADDILKEYIFTQKHGTPFRINIDFYDESKKDLIAQSFGCVSPFSSDCGGMEWPIVTTGKQEIVGSILLEYLLVFAFPSPCSNNTIREDEARILKLPLHPVFMGHRGSGANHIPSHKDIACFQENTMISFCNAVSRGYDFIEFDVNVTACGVPVIFHDLSVPVSIGRKEIRIPIDSLSMEEFKVISETNGKKIGTEMQIDKYPTLEELLLASLSTGLDIEIKYPSTKDCSIHKPLHSRNELIDAILAVVFSSYQNEKPIFFSSFDPQCCILLQEKQQQFPVFLLTEAGEEFYPDEITKNSIEAGIQFCSRVGIYGMIPPSGMMLEESVVQSMKRNGLMVFSWGAENNDKSTIQQQQYNGVDGIITDHFFPCESDDQNIGPPTNDKTNQLRI